MTRSTDEWERRWSERCFCTPPGDERQKPWGHALTHHAPSAFGRRCERSLGWLSDNPDPRHDPRQPCACPRYLPIFDGQMFSAIWFQYDWRRKPWPFEPLTPSRSRRAESTRS